MNGARTPQRWYESEWLGRVYVNGGLTVGFFTFAISYIYCIATYGFLFGLGLGWLPSLILATIVGFVWPLLAALVLVAIALSVVALGLQFIR